MGDNSGPESIVSVSRRSVLKAGAVSAVGVGLFSGTASATDDRIEFTVECFDDVVKVTLTNLIDANSGESVDPSTLQDLEVVLGKREVIDIDGNGRIARLLEIEPCVNDEPECQPAATADGSDADVRPDGILCFVFDREEAGLDDVTEPVEVAFAGTYFNDSRSQDLGSFDGVTTFDPMDCVCAPCESGEDLLVKYEWEDGEFVVEEDGDENITLESVELDEDGEPKKAYFTTTYCGLDAVVKAANEYEVTDDAIGEFCVEAIDGHAISNIRFYCVAPDDLSVGNSDKGEGEDNGKKKGRQEERSSNPPIGRYLRSFPTIG